jgi:peptidoglycan hydrolase-like protein with peptidoglycan-binding domain
VNRTAKGTVALVVAAVCGAAVTIAVRGTPAPPAPDPPPVGTAALVRTDLASTVLTQGTLGYTGSPPVVNGVVGVYTNVLAPGTVVQAGQVLYRVDNEPVVLMNGGVPAWRVFAAGMSDGPDVQELEANLIVLGDARGLFTQPTDQFGPEAQAAVERWQSALGVPVTGSVDLGAIVFEPTAVRIESAMVAPGQRASAGDLPYQVTTTARSVSVPLTPNDPTVAVGQQVSIELPSGATTPGQVTAIGAPPPSGSSGSASSGSSATTDLTVTPADTTATGTANGEAVQVALTVQSVRHVLAVPIAALVALAGGGYGLEVVEQSGQHRLVGVHTGVFAGGDVQVTGGGLTPGTRVVVAQ